MSSPLLAFNKTETMTVPHWKTGSLLFSASDHHITAPEVVRVAKDLLGGLEDFKYRSESKDHKWADYLLVGMLSLLIHGTVVDHFKGAGFEQEIIEPVKQPPKVQITLSRPAPKPIAPPPQPPQVKSKPPVQKAVPLKPPKPRPVQKVIEQPPVIDTPPVTNSVPVDSTPAPAAPSTPPAPVVEEKITAPTAGADYLNNPAPEYPEIAQERGWEGKVLMKVHVQADGRPDNISVIKSSGQQVLDDAAVKTVYKWSFVPAKRGTTPIAGYVTVPITFNLS